MSIKDIVNYVVLDHTRYDNAFNVNHRTKYQEIWDRLSHYEQDILLAAFVKAREVNKRRDVKFILTTALQSMQIHLEEEDWMYVD